MATAAAEATRVEAPALAAAQAVLLYPVHGPVAAEQTVDPDGEDVKNEAGIAVVAEEAATAVTEKEARAAVPAGTHILMVEAVPVVRAVG